MEELTISNASPGVPKEGIGQALDMNTERYEPFDLKIGKLTRTDWERTNMMALAHQLMAKQGKLRSSVPH